jgi:hypothetical protein
MRKILCAIKKMILYFRSVNTRCLKSFRVKALSTETAAIQDDEIKMLAPLVSSDKGNAKSCSSAFIC